MSIISWMDRNIYGNFADNWDNTSFAEKIREYIRDDFHILDMGAGAGILPQLNFRGKVSHVCGIDPDERVLSNPYLDEAIVATGESIPYPDGKFDIVFSANVLEHLPDPVKVFGEIFRVLKPGGVFLFKTPNKWHYVTLIARMTPHWFHEFINRVRGRNISDTFPTLYKANTYSTISRLASEIGFHIKEIRFAEGRPEYMRISGFTYVFGMMYEKVVNKFSLLKMFRVIIIGALKKYKDTE